MYVLTYVSPRNRDALVGFVFINSNAYLATNRLPTEMCLATNSPRNRDALVGFVFINSNAYLATNRLPTEMCLAQINVPSNQ